MLLDEPLEALGRLGEERETPDACQAQEGVEILPVAERDAEVAGVHLGVLVDPVGQVAHKLVTEEVERDAVGVPARQLAPKQLDVEGFGFVEVPGWDRQVRMIAPLAPDWIVVNRGAATTMIWTDLASLSGGEPLSVTRTRI